MGQKELGRSFGRVALRRPRCDWVLGAPSPLWAQGARPPPTSNVFQVLSHQKQRSFSLLPENEESSLVAEESFSEMVIFGYSKICYFTGNPAEVPVIRCM